VEVSGARLRAASAWFVADTWPAVPWVALLSVSVLGIFFVLLFRSTFLFLAFSLSFCFCFSFSPPYRLAIRQSWRAIRYKES
jgi:hypothetical protein